MRRLNVQWLFIGGVIAAVVIAAGGAAVHFSAGASPRLADSTSCTTCLTVSAPSASPVLYPGAQPSSIPVTFTNTTNAAIYVTQLEISFTNSFATCPASNFQVADTTSGATTTTTGAVTTIEYSPAQTIAAGQTWTDSKTTLSMVDSGSPQDDCQGLGLTMTYTGTANYTVMTATALAEASDSSTDTAVLTATVTPNIQPASAGHTPGSGDGSVDFYSCTDRMSAMSCTTWLGTAPVGTGGVASLPIPAGAVGSYNLEAVFEPSDPSNFVTSTSPIVTDTISGCVSVQTAGAAEILTTGQTYNGNYTVSSGSSLWLDGGTINGSVTVAPGGQFAATGGTVNGNVSSSGGPIAMAGTMVTGNVQQQSGGLSLGPGTTVKGNAQALGGGPFCSQGASSSQVVIKLNLTVQGLTSGTGSLVCATTVGNNLQWQQNSSSGAIGSCGDNTILGNLLVQNNSGALTIGSQGSGNVVSGNINVSGNTGGGTLTGNSSTGNCQLSGDKPGIVGTANSAGKSRNQCNTGPAGA